MRNCWLRSGSASDCIRRLQLRRFTLHPRRPFSGCGRMGGTEPESGLTWLPRRPRSRERNPPSRLPARAHRHAGHSIDSSLRCGRGRGCLQTSAGSARGLEHRRKTVPNVFPHPRNQIARHPSGRHSPVPPLPRLPDLRPQSSGSRARRRTSNFHLIRLPAAMLVSCTRTADG